MYVVVVFLNFFFIEMIILDLLMVWWLLKKIKESKELYFCFSFIGKMLNVCQRIFLKILIFLRISQR